MTGTKLKIKPIPFSIEEESSVGIVRFTQSPSMFTKNQNIMMFNSLAQTCANVTKL
jgi:hypothetical protein